MTHSKVCIRKILHSQEVHFSDKFVAKSYGKNDYHYIIYIKILDKMFH